MSRTRKMIKRFVQAADQAHPLKPECFVKWGWSFCLGHSPDLPGTWMFSAKLMGSSSTERDWERLGTVLALVYEATGNESDQCPEPLTPIEDTAPGATHYWIWPVIDRAP